MATHSGVQRLKMAKKMGGKTKNKEMSKGEMMREMKTGYKKKAKKTKTKK